ncbi:MAG: S-layer homology domain-containing protein [Clostridiaceae bacterium]|nr:S-layer homology domain-containing protein [Clostridiaceae bacterium]
MKKTIISLVMVAVLLVSIFPAAPVFAARSTEATTAYLKLLRDKVDTYGYAPTSYNFDYEGKDVLYADFADFTGDGQDELFIAYYISTTTIQVEIWTWDGSNVKMIFDKVGYGTNKWKEYAYVSTGMSSMQYIALTKDSTGKAYIELHDYYNGTSKTYYSHIANGWWVCTVGAVETTPLWVYYGDYDFKIDTADSIEQVKKLLSGNASVFYSDVAENAWYNRSVMLATENGLMSGAGNGSFNPNGTLTIAEAITMACRLHNKYNGDNASFARTEPWYKEYVDYAVDNGIIKNGDFSDMNTAATRAQMAYIFANAVSQDKLPVINEISTVPDVSAGDRYAKEILALYKAGILTGDSNHNFQPNNSISRAEAAAIIVRIVLPEERQKFQIN